MRFSTSATSLALLASPSSATPLEAGNAKRGADNCLRAIRGTPSVGLGFCSSALSIVPVTATSYVAAPTVTIVVSSTITASTTLTSVTSTATVTITAGAGQVDKRRTDPTEDILSKCDNDLSRISSACGEFLVGVETSTTTVVATTTPTLLTTDLATTTKTDTFETAVTTTITAQPAVYTNLILNGAFDDSRPYNFWNVDDSSSPGSSYTFVNAIYASPPSSFSASLTSGTGYVLLAQSGVVMEPGKKYVLSVDLRTAGTSTGLALGYYVDSVEQETTVASGTSWRTYVASPYTAQPVLFNGHYVELRASLLEGGVPDTIYLDNIQMVEVDE